MVGQAMSRQRPTGRSNLSCTPNGTPHDDLPNDSLPNDSVGISGCASVIRPCMKPVDEAWHIRTNGVNGNAVRPLEFVVTDGGLVCMVHHSPLPGPGDSEGVRHASRTMPRVSLISVVPGSRTGVMRATRPTHSWPPDLKRACPRAQLHNHQQLARAPSSVRVPSSRGERRVHSGTCTRGRSRTRSGSCEPRSCWGRNATGAARSA